MATRSLPILLLLAALAAACSTDRELRGAAAARSRGAVLGDDAPAAPAAEGAQAPARPYDQWLDDTRKLATVNGQVIPLGQVRHAMGPAYDQYLDRRDVLTGFVNKKVRDLVVRRLVVAEGKRVGLSVSDEDMDRDEEREAKRAAAAGSTIEQMIRDFSMTRREWDENRRETILFLRSQAYFMGLFPDFAYAADRFRPCVEAWVSPAEVRAWGERHRADLDRPRTATVRILYLCVADFAQPGDGDEDAWRRCAAALDALEGKLKAGEPFAAVAELGRRFPGAGEGGLYPPVTSGSGDLKSQYREWAFSDERKEGDVSPRMKVPAGYVVLRLEKRDDAASTDIEEWGPVARAEIEARRRALAWADCQARLLEEAVVAPAGLRAEMLADLRAEARRIRRELEPPEEDRTAAAPVR
jgi:hypothetical protein